MMADREILGLVSRHWKDGYEMAAKRQRQWKWALRLVDFIAYAMACNLLYYVLVIRSGEATLAKFNFFCISVFTIQFIGNLAAALWQRHLSIIRKIGASIGFTLGIALTLNGSAGAMLGMSIVYALLGVACSVAAVFLAMLLAVFSESATRIGAPIAYPIKWLIKKILMRRLTVANQSCGWVAGGIPGQFSHNSQSVQSIFTDSEIHQNSHQRPFQNHRQRPRYVRSGLSAAGFAGLFALTDEEGVSKGDSASDFENSIETTSSQFDLDTQMASGILCEACDLPSTPWVNPSTGLPMLDDMPGGIDVGGNLWGESDSYDHHWSDTSISSGFDDSFSHHDDYGMSHDSFGGSDSTSLDEI